MENPYRPAIHRDPYEVLGVSRVSSSDEIRNAYRKLALRYHPDKNIDNPEASEFFKEVSYSYSILSDPERRKHNDSAETEVATIIEPKDEGRAKQKSARRLHKICLKTGSPMESHAASVLTPYAFCKFQEELVLAPQYASYPIEDNCFLVRHHTQLDGGCKVIWKPQEELISCSCHQFEFSGTLCGHALRVLSTNNCFQIPEEYLPSRWRSVRLLLSKFSRTSPMELTERVQMLQSMVSTILSESVGSEENLEVASEQIALALSRIREFSGSAHDLSDVGYGSPSESLILPEAEDTDGIIQCFTIGNAHESYALGKQKERRAKDEIEISRKRRQCPASCCAQFEHDSHECPMIGSEGLNRDDLGFLFPLCC